jgi:hypothetical protein
MQMNKEASGHSSFNYPFEAEFRLNKIYELVPYRRENTTYNHYKDRPVDAV